MSAVAAPPSGRPRRRGPAPGSPAGAGGTRSGATIGALFGMASGVYATDEGGIDHDRVARDIRRAGVNEATGDKYRTYYVRDRHPPISCINLSTPIGR